MKRPHLMTLALVASAMSLGVGLDCSCEQFNHAGNADDSKPYQPTQHDLDALAKAQAKRDRKRLSKPN